MTVAVFGGTGFIGKHLTETLQASGADYLSFSRNAVVNDPRHVSIDFEDPETYRDRVKSARSIVLLVSQTTPGTIGNDIVNEMDRNVLPHMALLKAIAKSSVEHVIYVSSGGQVYGAPAIELIDETCPSRPVSAYGAGKSMIETLLGSGLAAQGKALTILRPSNPTGEGQFASNVGLVAKAVLALRSGLPLEIWGDGSVVRDYFDVKALADAILLPLTFPVRHPLQIFNVGSVIGLSVNEVIRLVEEVGARRIDVVYKDGRPVDVPRNVLATNHIQERLGWTRGRDLPTIVESMIAGARF